MRCRRRPAHGAGGAEGVSPRRVRSPSPRKQALTPSASPAPKRLCPFDLAASISSRRTQCSNNPSTPLGYPGSSPFLGIVVKRIIVNCVQKQLGDRIDMVKALQVHDWVSLVMKAGATPKRDSLMGVSVTLAARLLGVSRSRVHQLVKARKLTIVDVYDERAVRIGHLVTLTSIARRRRTVRPRRTQWQPAHLTG
jgi:hypothetical protein